MGQLILLGNPPISVALRRSARARKLSLRVSRLDGRVTLTLPRGVPDREGLSFLQSREGWLRGHLDNLGRECRICLGGNDGGPNDVCRAAFIDHQRVFYHHQNLG